MNIYFNFREKRFKSDEYANFRLNNMNKNKPYMYFQPFKKQTVLLSLFIYSDV